MKKIAVRKIAKKASRKSAKKIQARPARKTVASVTRLLEAVRAPRARRRQKAA
jgi:hypothetical protein